MDESSRTGVLKIYISNTDKFEKEPLYEVLVYSARRFGLSGATVHRGIMGYGASSVVQSVKFWEVSEKLPLTVEMIDDMVKLEQFVAEIRPLLEKIPNGCLVTIEEVRIAFSKKGYKKGFFEL